MNDEQVQRPANPRRRKKTKAEIIKENYLPTIIIGITVVLCTIFIITAIIRADAARKIREAEVAESIAAQEELKRHQDLLAASLLSKAGPTQRALTTKPQSTPLTPSPGTSQPTPIFWIRWLSMRI